jgi:hypothetical protein
MTEPVKREIIRRKALIIDLFTPEPPAELRPYFYRLLRVEEFTEAAQVAERIGVYLDACPADGGWIIFISKWKCAAADVVGVGAVNEPVRDALLAGAMPPKQPRRAKSVKHSRAGG